MKRGLEIAGVLFAAVVLAAAAYSLAAADTPYNIGRALQYMRVGGSSFGHAHVTATTDRAVLENVGAYNASTNPEKVFRWGSIVTVCCEAETDFYWTQTSTVTVTAGATAGSITANSETAIGNHFRVYASHCIDQAPWRSNFIGKPSQETKSCDGSELGRPCGADGDCPGSSTCGVTGFNTTAGAYLISIAEAAGECAVRIDK